MVKEKTMSYTENVCAICGTPLNSDESDLCPYCQAKYGIDDDDDDNRATRIRNNQTRFLRRYGT